MQRGGDVPGNSQPHDGVQDGRHAQQGNVGAVHDADVDGIEGDHGQNRRQQVQDFELGVQNCGHHAGGKAGGHGQERDKKGSTPWVMATAETDAPSGRLPSTVRSGKSRTRKVRKTPRTMMP